MCVFVCLLVCLCVCVCVCVCLAQKLTVKAGGCQVQSSVPTEGHHYSVEDVSDGQAVLCVCVCVSACVREDKRQACL